MPQQNADNNNAHASKTQAPKSAQQWRGTIESVGANGAGVGIMQVPSSAQNTKILKRPIFVPFTVPGDIIEARIVEQEGKYAYATCEKIVTPSEYRTVPTCPHFKECGGCNLQHITYEEQLRQKTQQIHFLISRRGVALASNGIEIKPCVRNVNYRYRSKIVVRFDERIHAGYRKYHAHDIVTINHCDIIVPELLEIIDILNNDEDMRSQYTTLKTNQKIPGFECEVHLACAPTKKAGIYINLDQLLPQQQELILMCFEGLYAKHRDRIGSLLFSHQEQFKSTGQVQEHLAYELRVPTRADGPLILSFSPDVFIQSNLETNNVLVTTVLDMLCESTNNTVQEHDKKSEKEDDKEHDNKDEKIQTIIDLYAGIGNFSLPLATIAQYVIGVEGSERSVELARINALRNNLHNMSFIHLPIEQYVRTLHEHAKHASHIIIDPPRTGCTPRVLEALNASNIPTIMYVSCDPLTLASDLVTLQAQYVVDRIVAVDMFPNIFHVETVVKLRRKE